MKAYITTNGTLVIDPENITESFALDHWLKTATKQIYSPTPDPLSLSVTEQKVIDPEKIQIKQVLWSV